MSISDVPLALVSVRPQRAGLRTALIAGSLAAVVALVLSPADPAMSWMPIHPLWLITLVLAARYGARGLVSAVGVVIGVTFAEALAGHMAFAMIARLDRVGDLAALTTALVLAWIGGLHEARKHHLEQRVKHAEARADKAESEVDELADAALALRDRSDRAQTSLSFLAEIASRLDSADLSRAGQAALELALARTGARGGVVQLVDGARLKTLASRGIWSVEHAQPPAVFRDLVSIAAVERKTAVAAHEVADVRTTDSDLAAPILGEDGVVHGVLALRGIPYPVLTTAGREDLSAVARWVSRAMAGSRRDAGPAAAALRGGSRVFG
jgi:hypothetical protein